MCCVVDGSVIYDMYVQLNFYWSTKVVIKESTTQGYIIYIHICMKYSYSSIIIIKKIIIIIYYYFFCVVCCVVLCCIVVVCGVWLILFFYYYFFLF